MDPELKKQAIEKARDHFGKIVAEQLDRVERMKQGEDWLDYSKLKPIIIGIVGGDGIGPIICEEAHEILAYLLADEIKQGKVELRVIEGLTIENRAKVNKAIPDDVLAELKKCHAILKGPTTTPKKGDKWPNIESANVTMRRELDLFANVRPVRVPDQGIDWVFFRENTEDVYVLGSKGINVTDDLAIDFKVITSQGTERIIRLGFEHAKKNGIELTYLNTKDCTDPVTTLKDLTGGVGYHDVLVMAPVKALVEQADAILARDGCLNFFAGPERTDFSASMNFYNVHYASTHIVGTSGGNTDDIRESLTLMEQGLLNPAGLVTHIGGISAVAETVYNLPKIPGAKKLIYTHLDFPLVALTDLAEKGKENPVFAELATLVAKHGGLWNAEAETYLLTHCTERIKE